MADKGLAFLKYNKPLKSMRAILQLKNRQSGWMHETSAQGWCTGKTQMDGMGREDRDGEHM